MVAMKVIQAGNTFERPEKWPKRFKCGRCSSTLEVEKGDLTRYMGYGNSETGLGAWDYATFLCPHCRKFNSAQISGVVLNTLPARNAQTPPGGEPCVAKTVLMRNGY